MPLPQRGMPGGNNFYKKYHGSPESGSLTAMRCRSFGPAMKFWSVSWSTTATFCHGRWRQSSTGAVLKFLECEKDGTLTPECIRQAVTARTRLVAVAHISNVFGRVNPVREITELAHRQGAVVVVDAAQSAPHIPLTYRRWTLISSLFRP